MNLLEQNWDLIAAWLALRRHGSLSAAARALGLSQPTMRRRIETLEQALGQRLFTRGPGGLTPLAEDAALMALAEAMEAAAAAFARTAVPGEGAIRGTVRISAPDVFGAEVLPPILLPLRRAHPGLVIELSLTNAVEDLLRRDADIAIRLVPPAQGALVARKLAPTVFGLFAAPGPLAEAAAGLSYEALRQAVPFVTDDRSGAMAAGLAALGLGLPEHPALRCDNDLAQLAAIRAGLGVGITQVALGRALGLVPVCPEVQLARDTWLVMHEDLRAVPRLRAVFDHLVAALSRR